MSDEIKANLKTELEQLTALVASGQHSDAFQSSQRLQLLLVLSQTASYEKLKAGIRDLYEAAK